MCGRVLVRVRFVASLFSTPSSIFLTPRPRPRPGNISAEGVRLRRVAEKKHS